MFTFSLPFIASIAAAPVSPEVAPNTTAVLFWICRVLLKKAAASWSPKSLKAAVGPWNNSNIDIDLSIPPKKIVCNDDELFFGAIAILKIFSKCGGKISKLSNHDKLINLIAVQDEKDVNYLLQSVDQVFIEVFKLKQKDLPWLSNNSEEEWDNVMRKVRLAIFKLYFEHVKKERTYH